MNQRSRPSEASLRSCKIDEVCDRFEKAWIAAASSGRCPRLEDYLGEVAEPDQPALLRRLLELDIDYRRQQSATQYPDDYRRRFPGYSALIEAVFVNEGVGHDDAADEAACVPPPGPSDPPALSPGDAGSPSRLGRYRVIGQLGQGGFGIVYKAYDDELQRDVAIKVPHRHRLTSPRDAEMYLTEARVVAGLSHPGIVPVYDMGRTDDGLCYLVSKFIEGCDLRTRLVQGRFAVGEAAGLAASVAEALHHAHQRGLVHRDIKPANILLDAGVQPVITDFGLALRDVNFGTGPTFAGTPAYMSPEQARGEGHRVDARTDVYSLGVVFYELLTGERPFRAQSQAEVLEQIRSVDPRPPRQLDDTIPKELDRICLKALAKRAADRYSTAIDLAEDLRQWQTETPTPQAVNIHVTMPPAPQAAVGPVQERPADTDQRPARPDSATSDSGQSPTRVVPKGLRSFDADDADFFLELLPGPRDRYGLPDSLRFWRTRIEAADPGRAFAVGVLYGPSGCGKSSLVKAGLLPRLADHVLVAFVEATPQDTETWLLKALRKQCARLPEHAGLVAALAGLRRGDYLPGRHKVLIVLDQFEQWLHAKRAEQGTELVQALRHCDGQHVQCLVLVRDDFGMAIARFMHDLEIPIVEGTNFATVDRFDRRHARKVLTKFGRSFGCLPEDRDEVTQEQAAFLDEAVAGLAEDGKVISVRLALFAEMVKARPWTAATLREVGGAQGLGVAFLEDALGGKGANPEHQVHQRAVRAILKALLPVHGTDLKGHRRSYQELLQASGYGRRPKEFDRLMHMLDAELRLMTPSDPESGPTDEPLPENAAEPHYQLTHDYLVHAIRQWLTRKQRETWRGRAEIRLEERANLWNARPENRLLPAAWEWIDILLFTRRRDWRPAQQRMMRQATWHHGLWAAAVILVLVGAFAATHEIIGSRRAAEVVNTLAWAKVEEVSKHIGELPPYRRWADPVLRQMVSDTALDPGRRLNASLALLPVNAGQVDYLTERLLAATPDELLIIRAALSSHQAGVADRLWQVLENSQAEGSARFRAACALAAFEPDSPRWGPVRKDVAVMLVGEKPLLLGKWMEALSPARRQFVEPLAVLLRDGKQGITERLVAANLLATYAADQPAEVVSLLEQELDRHPAPDASDEDKDRLAQRQANAAAVLLQFGRAEKIWPLLYHSEEPRLRTYLIHAFGQLGVSPLPLIGRLEQEDEVSARRALLLCLGEFSEEKLSLRERQPLIDKLKRWYRDDPDPGVHSAVDWLLCRWKQGAEVAKIDDEKALQRDPGGRRWYVNGQGQTMAIIPGPVEFQMGSPASEPNRNPNLEGLRPRRLDHTFAIATKEVTVGQFQKFLKAHPDLNRDTLARSIQNSTDPDGPVVGVMWFEAVQYCRWLSEQEKVGEDQMCYGEVAEIQKHVFAKNPDDRGIRLPPDYLTRTGYRLPTEAEWEYACRAGAMTSRPCGSSETLLDHYAWFGARAQYRAQPVGRLKPNDFGLFDMLGNASEWTNDKVDPEEPLRELNEEERGTVWNQDVLLFRGGSVNSLPRELRSANRNASQLMRREPFMGFRVARTQRSHDGNPPLRIPRRAEPGRCGCLFQQ